MAKFFDGHCAVLMWVGLFFYGVSALVFAAGNAYVNLDNFNDSTCFDNVDAFDLISIPDCYPRWL